MLRDQDIILRQASRDMGGEGIMEKYQLAYGGFYLLIAAVFE
jgi:hypothetical protein